MVMTTKSRSTKRRPVKRSVSLADMHDAVLKVEGVLRQGIETERMIRSLSKVPPKHWLRVGLQGLIRALEHEK